MAVMEELRPASGEIDVEGPVNVYVPTRLVVRSIKEGSGIVGTMQDNLLRIDFEGNLYGAANMETFADRVDVAWGRHHTQYPTIARLLVDPAEMVKVGEYDPEAGIVAVSDLPTLSHWIGVELSETEPNPELHRAGR